MKSLLYYLIQVTICSGILYGYYHFFLRNKKFHAYNRYYLLSAIVLSIVIPFFNIPIYFSTSQGKSSLIFQTLTVISPYHANQVTYNFNSPVNHPSVFTIENILKAFYLAIAFLMFARVFMSMFQIKKLLGKYVVEHIDHIYFVNTEEPGTPFSFFKWLFWNKEIDLKSDQGQQIFRHELFHINKKHSWDNVFIETVMAIFWMNPFLYIIKKELAAIHEFLADEFATREVDKATYAELLLMQVLNTRTHLINPFFQNQVRRRMAMIMFSRAPEHQYFRKVMVLPIAAMIIALFAFTYKPNRSVLISRDSADKNIPHITAAIKGNNEKFSYLPEASAKRLGNGRDTSRLPADVIVVINGKVQSGTNTDSILKKIAIPPDEISLITILKGDAAVAKYGTKAKNGAIEIHKKGNSPTK